MNIAFHLGILQDKQIGGGYTFQQSVIEEIIKYDFKTKVYIYYESNENIFSDIKNFKFINLKYDKDYIVRKIIKKRLFINKKRNIKSLDKLLKRDKVDFIYLIMPCTEIPNETPFILTVWDLAHKTHTYFPEVSINGEFDWRENYYNNAIQRASFVVIGNEVGKECLCKYYKMDTHRIKTNPMPTPDYVWNKNADESILDKYNLRNEKYLFYPAQFWAHKNHIRLLKAMKELKNDGFKMVFTGSNKGNTDYINQKIKEFDLENIVINIGFVTQEEIIALYKNAFALTYASWFGPDNIPPLEAMALCCPVVCSDFEGAKQQLKDCALYFDRTNEATIISAVKKLESLNLRKELTQKAYLLAKEYNAQNYIKNMIEIIKEFQAIRECWGNNQ